MSERPPGPRPFQVAGAEVGESTSQLPASVAWAGSPGRACNARLARWEMADPAMPGEPREEPGLYAKDTKNQ